jgi:CRISPR-associated Csx3 family protein
MGLLRGLLPRDKFMVAEAAPDGEGITGWSAEATQELVKAVRRKGKFLPQFVDWVCASVHNSTMPITLVDLGGMLLDDEGKFSATGVRLTTENERIMRECSHLIVIANPSYMESAVPTWIAEANRLGVKPLAILESVLTGADDEIVAGGELPMRARITKLDRENPPQSTTAKVVVDLILSLTTTEVVVKDGSEVADVNFPRLAETLNLPVKNGGADRDWRPSDLPKVLAEAKKLLAGKSEVRLWGNTPLGAPYHVLAANLSQEVWYADPKVPGGYVAIPEMPASTGTLLDWKVGDRDDSSLVEFVIPGQVFNANTLPTLTLPEVDTRNGVVISGKGPRWLTGAIARAYARAGAAWVAVFEPRESSRMQTDGKKWSEHHSGQAPAIVVYTRERDHTIGTIIPFSL